MCGVFFFKQNNSNEINFSLKKKLNQAISSQSFRGPDKKNIFFNENFCMGFNYLKITSGNEAMQPFKFGDLMITFNGEIYNFREIKKMITEKYKVKFLTNSDTEVVAASINFFGLKRSIYLFRGMFSILGYNFKRKEFFVARDRLGIKPLFYFKNKDNLLFSSTIESIRIALGKKLSIQKQTIEDYIINGALDLSNKTFFNDIKSFPPASFATFKKTLNEKSITKMWELNPHNHSKISDVNNLKKIINDTFSIHNYKKKSAIPLSSGLDSNIIDYQYKRLFRASLIGNNEIEDSIIKKLSKKKKIKLISNKNIKFEKILKEMAKLMDQPIRSSHWVYQFYLRKLFKKKKIRVIYSGDGADEVFGGYYYAFRYYLNENKKNLQKKVKENNYIINWLKNNTSVNNLTNKISLKDYLKLRLTKTHIPYWLRAEDEISMRNSLETRVPFLDHILMEETFKKNSDLFFHKNKNKNILRNIYSKKIEKIVLEQKKIGKPGYPYDTLLLFERNKRKIFKLRYFKNSNYLKRVFKNTKNIKKINIDLLFRLLFLYFWFDKKKHLY